jgi:hypothetical protein
MFELGVFHSLFSPYPLPVQSSSSSSLNRLWKEARRYYLAATALFAEHCPKTTPSEWGRAVVGKEQAEETQRRATKRATAKVYNRHAAFFGIVVDPLFSFLSFSYS